MSGHRPAIGAALARRRSIFNIDASARFTTALADALAFALRFDGRRRKHHAAEIMARIVAKRLAEHLERSGFVVMKRPPIGGSAPPYRGEAAP